MKLENSFEVDAPPERAWDLLMDVPRIGPCRPGATLGMVLASGVEEALSSGCDPAAAAERAAEGTSPPSDHNASAEFRQHLARVLTRPALEKALA